MTSQSLSLDHSLEAPAIAFTPSDSMSAPGWQSTVVPARLAFLAIYNPSLGPTDDTFRDQLVFYYSRAANEARAASKKTNRTDAAGGDALRKQENEQLRQIGLAQGMIDFARSFADGNPVDSIDTEKSRIVLHELEKGWWIVASVDLTRLPAMASTSPGSSKKTSDKEDAKPGVEYSSREVSPPALLLSQLLQAHFVFTLHHGPSITELFVKLPRDKFCNTLDRFWSRFCRTWDVLLHGNPSTDVFCGMKLSSGGELGMGVGEEEWGSGERDVLEDLTRRTEGLVDLVVARFGEPAPPHDTSSPDDAEQVPWLGSGGQPLASDGIIFGGISAIARPSLRNISLWMRQIYTYGDHAYGVRDNPNRERRKRRRRNPPVLQEPDPETPLSDANGAANIPKAASEVSAHDQKYEDRHRGRTKHHSVQGLQPPGSAGNSIRNANDHSPGIPPPIVSAAEQSLDNATKSADADAQALANATSDDTGTRLGIPDQYMKYLTFGLSTLAKPSAPKRPGAAQRRSTSNSLPSNTASTRLQKPDDAADADDDDLPLNQVEPMPDVQTLQDKIAAQKRQEEKGLFVIGLKGDLDVVPDDPDASIDYLDDETGGVRNILRTVQVEVTPSASGESEMTDLERKLDDAGLSGGKNDPLNFRRLRVLVYVQRPFMYCFLFQDRTPSLAVASFYKDLHRNLAPIRRPLLSSTSVSRIAQRIEDSQAQASPTASDAASVTSGSKSTRTLEPKPIYDLIWDPALLTVHTSIPNIPEPGTPAAEGISAIRGDPRIPFFSDWTRVDALNVHSQVLNTLVGVKANPHEYERTCKTTRGWWIVWMKLPASQSHKTATDDGAASNQESAKESGKEYGGAEESEHNVEHDSDSDDTVQPPSREEPPSRDSTRWFQSEATTKREPEPTNRIAILIRKGSDVAPPQQASTSSRAVSSMWQSLGLRSSSTSDETTGGSSTGWGPAALAGGIGIDPRKYVEGLLQLNR